MKQAKKVEIPENRQLNQKEYDKLSEHAYNSAFFYATSFNKSSAQIREKLYKKGYISDNVFVTDDYGDVSEINIVDDVLTRLEEQYLIDDNDYARKYVQMRLNQGKGTTIIRHELRRNGIENTIIDELLDDVDEDEITKSVQKSFDRFLRSYGYRSAKDNNTRKQKAFQYLVSKGFSIDTIVTFLNNNWVDVDE